mmetsp:Transcript_11767/g.23443  ORF Transcript_11767/g.23443 Transcript_11767/m.23443 type:complete len:214 (+) Transcript_11767:587-1228(+)
MSLLTLNSAGSPPVSLVPTKAVVTGSSKRLYAGVFFPSASVVPASAASFLSSSPSSPLALAIMAQRPALDASPNVPSPASSSSSTLSFILLPMFDSIPSTSPLHVHVVILEFVRRVVVHLLVLRAHVLLIEIVRHGVSVVARRKGARAVTPLSSLLFGIYRLRLRLAPKRRLPLNSALFSPPMTPSSRLPSGRLLDSAKFPYAPSPRPSSPYT